MAGNSSIKTAFVVGGSKGLGGAFVDLLSEQGYKVFAGSRNPKKSANHNTTNVKIDIADISSIKKAFEIISSQTDKLDLLVNCAAINPDTLSVPKGTSTRLSELDQKVLVDMFRINSIGPIMVTQMLAPLLSDGRVVNVSSYRASFSDRDKVNNYNNYGYASSKVALNMMTRDLAHDLFEQNTSVFAIDPGSVRTNMQPNGIQEPKESASKILKVLNNLSLEDSGKFFDNSGELFPL